MKYILIKIMLVAGLMLAGSSVAAGMPDVAKRHNCTSCHAIDKKLMGPSWQAVADKYKGDAGAAGKLSVKIVKGGSGVWGSIPMPAMPKLTDAEAKELVDFILGLAK